VYAVIKMAEKKGSGPISRSRAQDASRDLDLSAGVDMEGNYAAEELNEYVSVMQKLMRVRDVVLKVNNQYVQSASQADAYRTEPPFKLQGSYRDMNKIAERVVPIMNEEELETIIRSHYQNQAQTLTTGAEANLLKLNELLGQLSEAEHERWEDIKRTFQRNVLLGSADGDDRFSQVVAQMTMFSEGLNDIKNVLNAGISQLAGARTEATTTTSPVPSEQFSEAVQHLAAFNDKLDSIRTSLEEGYEKQLSAPAQKIQVAYRVPRVLLDVIKTQFAIMENWLEPIVELSKNSSIDSKKLTQSVDAVLQRYEALIERMSGATRK
jgi:hypothetical protein